LPLDPLFLSLQPVIIIANAMTLNTINFAAPAHRTPAESSFEFIDLSPPCKSGEFCMRLVACARRCFSFSTVGFDSVFSDCAFTNHLAVGWSFLYASTQ